MAKKETKFRQEFNVTEDGILGEDNTNKGVMNVEEILSLHIDIVSDTASVIVRGKIGVNGNWEQIISVPNIEKIKEIDLKQYEYIQIEVIGVTAETRIIIFGYDSPVSQKDTRIVLQNDDIQRNIEMLETQKDILEELKKMNIHFSLINDEEI